MTRRPITRPFPKKWFFLTTGYRRFLLRELTAFPIAVYLVILLVWLYRLGQGPESYDAMMAFLRHPIMLVLNFFIIPAAVYHSITWFNTTPEVMPVRIGEERVPKPIVAIGMGYGPWLVVSAILIWGVLR